MAVRDVPHDQERRAIVRAARVALWAWPSFAALDLYMCLVLYPKASIPLILGYRILGEVINYAAFLMITREPSTPVRIRSAHVVSYASMALLISLMSLQVGGLHSRYVHGVSIVVMVRAIVVPERYSRSFLWSLPILVAFPLVHWIASRLGFPESRFDAHEIAVFVSDYVFLVGSTVVGTVSGHLIWTTEQQLYRARRIGRYRLEAPIARGGMGEIWLARDETLRRTVALKLLRDDPGSDSTALARFEREAHAASTLSDPHTIRIFDYGASDDGIHFIAMEYLPGADLAALVQAHGPMPVARAVYLVRQACTSLAEAHAAAIVHRDVKPQNLYVTQVGEDYDFLKLLDFGIARFTTNDNAALTRTGAAPGTPLFMAPEQWMHEQVDARCDIYGLGATLYYVLTGKPPRDPVTPTAPRPSISIARGHEVSTELEELVARCLAPRPEDRFDSVRDVAAALDALVVAEPWTADDARQFWLVTHREMAGRVDIRFQTTRGDSLNDVRAASTGISGIEGTAGTLPEASATRRRAS